MPYGLNNKVSICLVGDIIQNRCIRDFKDDRFLDLLETIRSFDAVFGNLECLYHNWEMSYGSNYNCTPLVSDPEMLDELKWFGISAVSAANNHSFDCGEAGLVATIKNCRRFELPVAGVGCSIEEARAAAYVETPGGRLALLGGTTSFGLPDVSHAGPSGIDIPSKPGVAILRHHTIHTVPSEVFDTLRRAQRELVPCPPRAGPDEIQLFGGIVKPGDAFKTTRSCDENDLDQIGQSIRSAKKVSDFVIYSIHCHENGDAGDFYNGTHRPSTPEFLIEFAHFCIDQGCDVVFGHAPHIVRGIEIYKGRPIFYSLGNLFFQLETVRKVPPQSFVDMKLPMDAGAGAWGDAFAMAPPYSWALERKCYQSIAAACEFQHGELSAVRLIPLELGFGTPHSQRGRPVFAEDCVADEILTWLREVSKPFGTNIEDGSGFVYMERKGDQTK